MQKPQPQLAELLRTCVYPSSLLLKIAHIEFLDVKYCSHGSNLAPDDGVDHWSDDVHRYAVKYILSDGQLMVQALLHRRLAALQDAADVVAGDLLDIRRFTLKKSRRSSGDGNVIFLAIEDCHFLHQAQVPKELDDNQHRESQSENIRKRKRSISYSERDALKDRKRPQADSDVLPGDLCEPSNQQSPLRDNARAPAPVNDRRNTSSSSPPIEKEPTLDAMATARDMTGASLAIISPLEPAVRRIEPHHKLTPQPDKGNGEDILRSTFGARQILSDSDDDGDEFFETFSTNPTTVQNRRTALQKLNGNIVAPPPNMLSTEKLRTIGNGSLELMLPQSVARDTALPGAQFHLLRDDKNGLIPLPHPNVQKRSVRDGTFALSQTPTTYLRPPLPAPTKPQPSERQIQTQPTPQAPPGPALLPTPPFHTLASLRNPPPSQPLPVKSYTLTTLAVISWTGTTTIHRPGSLFPPKRHLKIVDPSLSASRPPSRQVSSLRPAADSSTSTFKGQNSFQDAVTVAVYIDAASFKPPAGNVVLFRGLVMQRLGNGDIILNAYGRLKEQRFEEDTPFQEEQAEGNGMHVDTETGNGSDVAGFDSHWFITDHAKIRALGFGSRLDYYLEWWAEKQRANQAAQA